MDIKLFDYQKKYIKLKGIHLTNYLSSVFSTSNYKTVLNKFLQDDLLKYKNILDKNIIENVLIDLFEEQSKQLENKDFILNESKFEIDIYSPFFDLISKENFFKYFSINIPLNKIVKYNLQKDYISVFENFNKSNKDYNSLNVYFTDNNDINYLKDFKININKIKKILLYQEDNAPKINDEFYNIFFSFLNVENNLISLHLSTNESIIKTDSFNNLNNLKSLKDLYMKNFIFTSPFLFKLKNLIKLYLKDCENIMFEKDCFLNLIELELNGFEINEDNLLKFPMLEKCILPNTEDLNYSPLIDFSSLINLKYFEGEIRDFILLDNNTNLSEIILYSNDYNDYEDAYNNFKTSLVKTFSMQNLKRIQFTIYALFYLDDDKITQIEGENLFTEKLELILMPFDSDDFILNNMIKKFPNLTTLLIDISKFSVCDNSFSDESDTCKSIQPVLNIIEDLNSKIKKFTLITNFEKNIYISCLSFEKLVDISLCFFNDNILFDLKDFPLFSKKCKIKFKSLTNFYFRCFYTKKKPVFKIIKNLYNNFESMPILKYFYIYSCINVKKVFVNKYVKKIVSTGVKHYYLGFKNIKIERLENLFK